MTNVTAMPMPNAVSSFLDTPRNAQMPSDFEKIKLFAVIATIRIISGFMPAPPSFSARAGGSAS